MAIDASKLRHGRVRGRYFRENFAQAGIDLTQIIPELVTNADAAIAAGAGERGRIQLRIGPADPGFLSAWKVGLRGLRLPALSSWRYELVCADDGEGVDADLVDQRLGALGVVPEHEGHAAFSDAGYATSGWPRVAGESKVCAAAERWSRGSCPPTVTSRTCTRTYSTAPPRERSAASSGSRTRARG